MFDIQKIRNDFPILSRTVNGKPLVYFDNGATAQKPKAVIDTLTHYYTYQNSNIHRGVHTLSREITTAYEEARKTIQLHINAKQPGEIIFTRGTTESINLVAHCFGKLNVSEGDEILITQMEHHSNIVPWQQLCEERKAVLKYVPINEEGELKLDQIPLLLSNKTKLVAFTHISNTLGTINPVKEIIQTIRSHSCAAVLIDGAQAVPHLKPDVQELDCDFYAFSGHKLFGPTGVGILYAKSEWLSKFGPYQTGGGTIKTVSMEKTEFAEGPLKFEAGTPHIEGGIGLAAAINYVNAIGFVDIQKHEENLMHYATKRLTEIGHIRIYGSSKHKTSVIAFNVIGAHPFDVGTLLDKYGIAIRSGHHCTQPLCQFYNIPGTIRASFAFYNTIEEIDLFIEALKKSIRFLL
ncbi:MAG: cysteine desulfurase [Bacteroidota bacterium]|jgi:cysteine desulfurase/selenocysteine lyase|nr:cysteine desulfurase [Bacteroidota bacterium]